MISQLLKRSGDDDEVDTPVPIPNTEVKHFGGDDSWACPCENSKLPVLFLYLNCLLKFTKRFTKIIYKVYE